MLETTNSTGATGSDDAPTLDPRLQAISDVFGDDFGSRFREPVLFEHYTFSSPPPKLMYRRDFQLLSRALFLENVYRRRLGFNVELLDNFALMVGSKMDEVTTLFERRQQQLRTMLKQQNVDPQKVYLQDERILVPIIAAHSRGFMKLLQMLDESYQLIGCASLYGVMSGAQRRTAEMESRKAVRSFIGRVREAQSHLRKEMMRLRAAGQEELTPEVAQAENLINEAQESYDKHDEDRSTAVDPANAAEVLDSMIAQANTISQVSGRKSTKKSEPAGAALTTDAVAN